MRTREERLAEHFRLAAEQADARANGKPILPQRQANRTSPPRNVSITLRTRLQREFGVGCTSCFNATLAQLDKLSIAEIRLRTSEFANSIRENAHEMESVKRRTDGRKLIDWAKANGNGDSATAYERLIIEACDACEPTPAVDTKPSTGAWIDPITNAMTAADAAAYIGPPAKRSKQWQHDRNTKRAMRSLLDDAVVRNYPKPEFSGRGIVTSGGGEKYFPLAFAMIYTLRKLGCTLPVELWHIGPSEMTNEMRAAIDPLAVTVRDCFDVPIPRMLAGWESKPHSIMHSRFAEVLYLDADNLPAVDPTSLFTDQDYRKHGAMFWPDLPNGKVWIPDETWDVAGIPYGQRHKPAFESGQILINKEKCWNELCVTMHLNEYSDCWYDFVYGDKDTFKLAWHRLGTDYAMPPSSRWVKPAIHQYDMHGKPAFYHACQGKDSIRNGKAMAGLPVEINQSVTDANRQLRYRLDGTPTSRAEFESMCRSRAIDAVMCDGTVLTRAIGRFLMYCDPADVAITPHLRSCGFWESWVTLATMKVVKPGWKCVNVGANLGYYSLLLAYLTGETVEAFEPLAKVAGLLRKSVAENNLPVNIHQLAAYSSAGMRTMSYRADYMAGAALNSQQEESTIVECVRLDDVIDRADLIFIDAEGAEAEIMAGAERLLSQGARVIVELDPRRSYPAGWLESLSTRWSLRWCDYDGNIALLEKITEMTTIYLSND